MKNTIVNADDFGSRPSVNKAIIELFDEGLIDSTTIMANMPGFDEAIELAHAHQIADKVGVHLVLSEGIPLTEEIRSVPGFFDMDADARKALKKQVFLDKNQQRLIYREYSSQIIKTRKNSIKVNHLDSHHHMHEMWGIMEVLLELLKAYKIPRMRILLNLESNSFYKKAYRNALNGYLKLKGVNYSDYFGSRVDFLSALKKNPALLRNKTAEIMVHPDYNSAGQLIDVFPKAEYDFEYLRAIDC